MMSTTAHDESDGRQYGLLCNRPEFFTYPDLVCYAATDQTAVCRRAAQLAAIHPGLEYVVMVRAVGGPWREPGSRHSPQAMLAERWRIQIDRGAW